MYDPHTHSFITKVWLEESDQEAGRATWRGIITHVPSGKQRYLSRLDEVAGFIAPYIERMGVRLSIAWRIKCWLRRRVRRAKDKTPR
jgi:hypothetical protein